MKKVKARTVLDEILRAFGKKMADLRFQSSFTLATFKDAHVALTDRIRRLKNFSKRHSTKESKRVLPVMWNAAPAVDLTSDACRAFSIGAQKAEDEELLAILVSNLNYQHLWLFVNAYEIYETYFKDLYGALGYLDRKIWRGCDFGKAREDQIKSKQLAWFQEQVRRTVAKHNIKEILSALRSGLDHFERFEQRNPLSLDVCFWTGVATLFRHVIVHSNGHIIDSDLVPALQEHTGHSFSGSSSGRMKLTAVRKYLRKRHEHWELWLIDERRLKPPYHFVNKPLFDMVEILTNHACLAYKLALRHFQHLPFWERQAK